MERCQPKAKRVSLPIKKKLEILEEVKRGVLKADVARKYGLSSSTLSTILKNRDKIQEAGKNGCAPQRKRARDGKYPELEKALVQWMKKCRSKNISIDGNILKAKAEDFSLQLGVSDFRASDGWVNKFKIRHGLVFKKLCGESASVNVDTVKNWKEARLQDLLKQHCPDDIFNANETGIFYKLMPDKSFVFKTESGHGGKRAKARLTVLVSSNMTGTEKLPLLVIGKAKKPRCFKGLRNPPSNYRANPKAWMTSVIFEDWVRSLDRRMKLKGRKIVLIVDNCTAHPEISDLEAITLEFLPPNATSLLQPMDQGIIQSLKRKYRKMLLSRIILCLDNDKDYNITVLGAIHLFNEAWNQVTTETIANCFRHAGFGHVDDASASEVRSEEPVPSHDVALENDNEVLETLRKHIEIPEGLTFAQFADADSNLQCTEELSDKEIIDGLRKESAQDDSDDECDVLVAKKTTFKEALDGLEALKSFLESSECSRPYAEMLGELEACVFSCAPKKKQMLITDFLK